jgi:magnesium-transporting ATPase (P-type)
MKPYKHYAHVQLHYRITFNHPIFNTPILRFYLRIDTYKIWFKTIMDTIAALIISILIWATYHLIPSLSIYMKQHQKLNFKSTLKISFTSIFIAFLIVMIAMLIYMFYTSIKDRFKLKKSTHMLTDNKRFNRFLRINLIAAIILFIIWVNLMYWALTHDTNIYYSGPPLYHHYILTSSHHWRY